MIKSSYANQIIKKFITENGKELLPFEIVSICKKNDNNEKLTDKERIIAGIRYYEFFAEGTSDQDYNNASMLADTIRNKFNIDYDMIINSCRKLGYH